MGLIETIGTLGCFDAGSATPTNAGTLCSASDLFCCSTGLFGRAKTNTARNRPIEQKTKPVKKRGLKKAALETSFLFIRRVFLWWKRVFIGGPNIRNPTLSTAIQAKLYRNPFCHGRRKQKNE